ncbi:CCDC3 protein, partial [Amia calva]|nr:CCDC3 protein [Amia calva]
MTLVLVACQTRLGMGCQLPSDWRPLSEGCRAELAEIIVYAKVLAIHQEVYSMYNYLPYQYEGSEGGLFFSAEIELLCDQAWGSMLEVPAGSRLNLTGLGYFSCQSHTVVQNYSYIFFLRMDENYNILPHGVNFQDAIFPDTQENRRTFSSLFQFSNCSQGQPLQTFSTDWEIQEDSRPHSSSPSADLSISIPLESTTLSPLQLIQNSTARLIFSLPRFTHATPLLPPLHRLPIAARIQFKTLTLTYCRLDHTAPSYLHTLISPYIPSRPVRSSGFRRLTLPPLHSPSSRAAPSHPRPLSGGMTFPLKSGQQSP